MPLSRRRCSTSLRHQSVSVSATRSRLSPQTRSHPFDDHGAEPLGELELDRRHHRQLVLADMVVRRRLREADGLADHLQEVKGNARPFAQLSECRAAELGEPTESCPIQEGERENSVPDGGCHPFERHPGLIQAVHPTRPQHVTRGQHVSLRLQDTELNKAIDIVGVDPGPPSHVLPRVIPHERAIVSKCVLGRPQDVSSGWDAQPVGLTRQAV
jgi:hypothetical protein